MRKTWIGGLLSIFSLLAVFLLFKNEITSFQKIKVTKNLFIDSNSISEPVAVNIAIRFIRVPCAILSLDIYDDLENHSMDINLKKMRVDKNGKQIGLYTRLPTF